MEGPRARPRPRRLRCQGNAVRRHGEGAVIIHLRRLGRDRPFCPVRRFRIDTDAGIGTRGMDRSADLDSSGPDGNAAVPGDEHSAPGLQTAACGNGHFRLAADSSDGWIIGDPARLPERHIAAGIHCKRSRLTGPSEIRPGDDEPPSGIHIPPCRQRHIGIGKCHGVAADGKGISGYGGPAQGDLPVRIPGRLLHAKIIYGDVPGAAVSDRGSTAAADIHFLQMESARHGFRAQFQCAFAGEGDNPALCRSADGDGPAVDFRSAAPARITASVQADVPRRHGGRIRAARCQAALISYIDAAEIFLSAPDRRRAALARERFECDLLRRFIAHGQSRAAVPETALFVCKSNVPAPDGDAGSA